MAKSKSSRRWLDRHVNDEYVKRARRDGYRSRAVYKLLEIEQKDRLFHPGQVVVDLGAAPGGWSQVVRQWVGERGRVAALDLLAMEPIAGVDFIQGDFHDQAVLEQLEQVLGGGGADLVISDMAPNISGMAAVDQPRAMYLCELALDFALGHLKPGGGFVAKVFQGEGFDEFLASARSAFKKVAIRKPEASRSRSREVYLVATERRL